MQRKPKYNTSIEYSSRTKLTFKILLVGKHKSGKTQLMNQLIKQTYLKKYRPTLGVELYSKKIQLENQHVTLQFWDTSGDENYQSLIHAFYKMANCVLFVYSQQCQLHYFHETIEPKIKIVLIHLLYSQQSQQAKQLIGTVLNQIKTNQDSVTPQATPYSVCFKDQCTPVCTNIILQKYVRDTDTKQIQNIFKQIANKLYNCYETQQSFRSNIDINNQSFAITQNTNTPKNKKCC